jgi:hypothetical protein
MDDSTGPDVGLPDWDTENNKMISRTLAPTDAAKVRPMAKT